MEKEIKCSPDNTIDLHDPTILSFKNRSKG